MKIGDGVNVWNNLPWVGTCEWRRDWTYGSLARTYGTARVDGVYWPAGAGAHESDRYTCRDDSRRSINCNHCAVAYSHILKQTP
jgi:hypothetical protein